MNDSDRFVVFDLINYASVLATEEENAIDVSYLSFDHCMILLGSNNFFVGAPNNLLRRLVDRASSLAVLALDFSRLGRIDQSILTRIGYTDAGVQQGKWLSECIRLVRVQFAKFYTLEECDKLWDDACYNLFTDPRVISEAYLTKVRELSHALSESWQISRLCELDKVEDLFAIIGYFGRVRPLGPEDTVFILGLATKLDLTLVERMAVVVAINGIHLPSEALPIDEDWIRTGIVKE